MLQRPESAVTLDNNNRLGQIDAVVDNDLVTLSSHISTDYVDSVSDQRLQPTHAEDSNVLAKNETKNVNRLRFMVAIILFFSTLSMALVIYFFVRNSEASNFQNAFKSDSNKLLAGVGERIKANLAAMDSFALMVVSLAKETNQTFPFVTIPTFAIKASKLLTQSIGFTVTTNPVVHAEQRLDWEAFTAANQGWVNETKKIQEIDDFYYDQVDYNDSNPLTIIGIDGTIPYDSNQTWYLPLWQNYPTAQPVFNYDFLASNPVAVKAYKANVEQGQAILSVAYNIPDPNDEFAVEEAQYWTEVNAKYFTPENKEFADEPWSDFMYPIIEGVDTIATFDNSYDLNEYPVVSTIDTMIYWREVIMNQLPESSQGIVVVFENACTISFTYKVEGPSVEYLGRGDLHDPKYDDLSISRKLHETFNITRYSGVPLNSDLCPYTLSVYPSNEYEDIYTTNNDIVFAVSVVLIFAFVSLVFVVYDANVERRQKVVMHTAEKSNAIVSSLFPSAVRDQMLQERQADNHLANSRVSVQKAPDDSSVGEMDYSSKALASLYPDTTVFFGDLAGFTAWSSSRNPSQVFTLLEVLFAAFDKLAKRRKVFKIETVGDSYVAVTGLPDPMKNHAVVMARFAFDCLSKTVEMTSKLTSTLGIETADLSLRIGLHSGPTTAGVLRGDKARFQLFGDTVNTASRMESLGAPGMIQVSQKTADLLISAGKESWLSRRLEPVEAKGKGLMTTYWLKASSRGPGSIVSGQPDSTDSDIEVRDTQLCVIRNRLVEWNVGLFRVLLQKVVAERSTNRPNNPIDDNVFGVDQRDTHPLDEISESIETQMWVNRSIVPLSECSKVSLGENVENQLRELITTIAYLYKSNPFHSFEHASHVVMSTTKLLDRMDWQAQEPECSTSNKNCLYLDSLTRFGIVFAALIHDVDHPGLSNMTLMKEEWPIAKLYENKSIAEQNSIDVAWKLFIQPTFNDHRQCMFSCGRDLQSFRQIIVNSVLATDIFDPNLKSFRENRWNQVFTNDHLTLQPSATPDVLAQDDRNLDRKNVIVIEHLIQASDVVHTMQHWYIYQKWNKRLFLEQYEAYRNGHSTTNPTAGWYHGELWFFDNYVIPLAEKLRICGVFGVSSDELLNYAIDNRSEWENKGRDLTKEWEAEASIK